MSCFKILFICTKFFIILTLAKAFAKDPDKVIVAKVNSYVITAQDILDATNYLPKKIKQKPLSEIYPKIVNELINQYLITELAYKENLDQNKKVMTILKKNKDKIIANFWLTNFLSNQIKEEKIKSFYKEYIENYETYKEYNASHILVKKEYEALEIIKKLKVKSEFSNLAKMYSIGPSKKNGGNLGWFRQGQMVKEFENATSNLKKGMVTEKPVKTKFGYHVIMLNDVRNSKPKKFNDIKQNIIDKIKQNSLSMLEKKIRHEQRIIIYDFKKIVNEINN